jgi:Tfp pilus assembly protein PilO
MRDQLILTIVGLVVVVALAVGFLVVPQFSTLGKLDKEISEAEAEVTVQKSLLEQREAMKDKAAETNVKTLALGNLMPDRPDLPSLIIELQDTAFAAGVDLTAITPSEPTLSGTGDYFVVPIVMTVKGTWADTADLLQKLPRLTRGVRTVDFAATVVDNADDDFAEQDPYSVQTLVTIEVYSFSSVPPTGPTGETSETAPVPAP